MRFCQTFLKCLLIDTAFTAAAFILFLVFRPEMWHHAPALFGFLALVLLPVALFMSLPEAVKERLLPVVEETDDEAALF